MRFEENQTVLLDMNIKEINKTFPPYKYIKNMIFDFSETVFMDSSGIGLLMGRYRALGMRGKCVQVMNVNSHIAKLLRLSGVGRYIDICKTQEAAEEQEGVYHGKHK